MERRGRRLLVLATLLALAAALLGAWALSRRAPDDRRLDQVLDTLRARGLESGLHLRVPLPDRFRRLTIDGTVDLVRTADGRLIVLFKTSLGWKGNYSGILYSDAPLRPGEVGADAYGRPAILIRGLESVVRRRDGDRRYEVDADLG